MLTINDLMCGKLVVQMKLTDVENVRVVLREIDKEFDSAFDFPNHLHHKKLIDEDQVRRLRSFVALYNYVRNESLYLRVIERKKLVTRNFIQRLVALLEAEWYRRRVGDVLLAMDQIRVAEDTKTQAKVIRQVDQQDRKILKRYREEDFSGVGKPLIPGKNVDVKSFKISSIFRGKQTRTFVKKHLREHDHAAQSIEQALTDQFKAAPQESGFGDFGDLWALPDDILLESGPDLKEKRTAPAPAQTPAPPPTDKKISVLLPPRVRAAEEGFAPTMKFATVKLEAKKSYIDDYLIVDGPRYAAMGQAYYRVKKEENGPHYTLQSIDPRVAPKREVARFIRQLKVLQKLDHDGCLRLKDKKSRGNSQHYMVLPELTGATIAERLKNGAFPMVEAFEIAEKILDALDHVHQHGFVYRDLRPDNLLLLEGKHAHPIIKDFRLVWIAKSSLPASAQAYRTRADELLGNPAYLAPETMTNDPVDSRTDLYSFAIMFFEMLTGVLPLRAHSPEDYLNQHLIGQPYTFAESRPDVVWAEELEIWVAGMLAKNKKNRPETARAALEKLKEIKNTSIQTAANVPRTVRHDPKALVSGIFNEFFKMEI